VFVYSPTMEGIHLRGGMVARGGIRWSDRREDFRTEVLGLMKAQMVKNSVIVPVGSKGGFVLKRPPSAIPDLKREVVDCYSTLIRGLLDLTDNTQGGAVIPPPRVVRADGDDPYLVVAADKGTATFSDIANGISQEYGFWLDDAFASGGSAGYDHKKMGITAKGAWECVKRHFREMGKDIQREDFTVVGVGDMGGDVFGNGMLLSPHIRLLAAFNHLHVFLDPDPDPASSLAERQRLFDLPGSTWADYDRKRISQGGGVYPRNAKSITLSAQARRALGVDAATLSPAEVIQAILRAQVDLLWLGGIGTFVRAGTETDADVGDRANDALRVAAAEVQAKVVGEGANLGFTQRARIEYGLRGGRINTDAIDNSAGVDCSDHEVNLKILLGEVERSGQLTRSERDALLREMTDEVGALVLRDNYLQTQSITVTQRLGAHLLDRLGRFMRALEKDGRLDRKIEFLPDDESLAERLQEQRGLTRPEIAVVMAYAKIALFGELLASDLPDDPALEGELAGYFPVELAKRYPDAIRRHGLRREIVATVVTNSIVNRVGVTFIHEVREKTGMPSEEIVRGYLAAREIFALRETWRDIEALDNHAPAQLQAALLAECGRLVEATTVWLLRSGDRPLDVRRQIEALGPAMRQVERSLPDLIGEERRLVLEARKTSFVEEGAPPALAARIASLPLLAVGPEIARVARDTGQPLERAAQVFFGVGTRHGFDWLRRAAGGLPADTAWAKLAISALLDDLQGNQANLAVRVLQNVEPDVPVADAIAAWAERKRALVGRAEQILAELQAMAAPDITMLAVASRQLKSLSL
jgi:glutamate dehydrogenase